MSGRGVVGIDRDVFNHPAFKPEPFPEAMAWIWLICEATHKTHLKRIDGHLVELHRGQLSHSIRFMGMAWQWSKSRVDRFLSMLEKRDMIRRETGTKSSVITIYNYDVYQRATLPSRDKVETPSGTKLGQSWDKLQNTENTEDNLLCEQPVEPEAERRSSQPQNRKPGANTKTSHLAEQFDRFRAAYPKRDGSDPREPARKKFEVAVRSGADPEIIIRGAELFAQAKKSIEAMSEITKAIKKGGDEAEEAKKKLQGFGIDASIAIGADGKMRDSAALALDVIEAYKRVSAGAKSLRDQQKNAPKGKQKALGAKALKEERRADQFAEDAGITGRLRVLIDEKSMPELRAIYEKLASMFPTMSSGQEESRTKVAKEAQEAGLKADAALGGVKDRLEDLGVVVATKVLPPLNDLLDKMLTFGKATGLIKETTKEKRDRESYEAASKRAEGMRAERLTTEDLQSRADASQSRFEAGRQSEVERARKRREQSRADAEQRFGSGGLLQYFKQMLSPEATAGKLANTAQASADNRKYENIGNDQRQISIAIKQSIAGGADIAAKTASGVNQAVAMVKASNAQTGGVLAP